MQDALFYDMGVNDSFLQMEENLQFEINVSVQELTRTPIFFLENEHLGVSSHCAQLVTNCFAQSVVCSQKHPIGSTENNNEGKKHQNSESGWFWHLATPKQINIYLKTKFIVTNE